ncbi:hypothetical protein Bca4012_025579 [Brassica carinata]
MVLYVTCQIREGGKFRALHLKCVDAGNTRAIYHEGLLKAPTSEGLHASIKILEPNIPNHDMSTLAVGIFNVCLGKEKEAAMIFRQFASYHYDLQSEMIVEVGESIQWHLERFGAFDLNINKYEDTFKFPNDLIIKTPSKMSRMSDDDNYSDSDGSSYMNMVLMIAHSDHGIPDSCPCGSQIMVEISKDGADIGKKYFVCKDFKDDGLHRKKEWNEAIEDETRRLKDKVAANEAKIRSFGPIEFQVDMIKKD